MDWLNNVTQSVILQNLICKCTDCVPVSDRLHLRCVQSRKHRRTLWNLLSVPMSSSVREHRQTIRRGSSPQAEMDHGLQDRCSQMEINPIGRTVKHLNNSHVYIENNNSFPTHKSIEKSFHIAYLHPNWCLVHPKMWSEHVIAVSWNNFGDVALYSWIVLNSLSAVNFLRDQQRLDLLL